MPHWICTWVGSVLVALMLCGASPGIARGDEAAQPRQFGFGFGLTGGYSASHTRHLVLDVPEFGLLDIHVLVPINDRVELQLWFPLSFFIWESLWTGGKFVDVALMARIHPVRGSGFFVGPGLQVTYLGQSGPSGPSAVLLEVPLSIGYEAASNSRSFGFTVALRPLVGVSISEGAGIATTAGLALGGLLEFGFNFYAMARPARPAREPMNE